MSAEQNKSDQVTEFFRKAMNILFVSNPQGTSIGVLIGVVLHAFLGLLTPLLTPITWIDMSFVKLWHLTALGVLIMNTPAYLRRDKLDPEITHILQFISDQKAAGNISNTVAKEMYKNLIEEVFHNYTNKNKKVVAIKNPIHSEDEQESNPD